MNKSSIPWTAKQVAVMYENGSLRFDNAIQRGEVWDKNRKSLLIDSLLRGYPVPPMFAIKTDETVKTSRGEASVYDCIDGKQRCTTISKFRNNEFALSGLEPITLGDEEIEVNGLTYDELPEDLRDDFDSAGFTIYFFTETTDEEVKEMMDRLNNGKALSGVEKARIKSKDLASIMELGKHELFGEYLTEKAILGYVNEDIVIKSFIQMNEPANPSFETKVVNNLYLNHVFTDEEKTALKKLYDDTYEVILVAESEAPKRVFKKIIKKINLLAIMSYVAGNNEDSRTIAEKIMAFFTTEDKTLSQSELYNEASKNATNRASNVQARNEALKKFCDSVSVPSID